MLPYVYARATRDVIPTKARKLGALGCTARRRAAPAILVRSRPGPGPGAFWSLLRRLPRGFTAGIATEGSS